MKRLLFALVASALFVPAAANAQFVNIRVNLPEVPPLVVVSPGIQVVENHDEEIFFHDGWYWVRREGRWYRARHPRREFVYVEHRVVPRPIFGIAPGHYRHYRRREMREEHRLHEREARLREREMHQRQEERRVRERREAERRREHREDRREVRHDVHQAAPVQVQPDRHQGNQHGDRDRDRGRH